MMNRKLWFAAIVAWVVISVYDGVVLGAIFGSYFSQLWAGIMRPTEFIPPAFVKGAMLALAMAYAFPKFAGKTPWLAGLRFGLVIGVLLWAYVILAMLVYFPLTMSGLVVLFPVKVLEVVLAGIAIGLIYGKAAEPS